MWGGVSLRSVDLEWGCPKRFIRSNNVDFLKMLDNYSRCKGTGDLKHVASRPNDRFSKRKHHKIALLGQPIGRNVGN